MKSKYSRFIGKSDNIHAGTYIIQTSGNTPLSGEVIDVRYYGLHSYQLIPDGGTISGDFFIKVSNDKKNWTNLTGFSYTNSGEAQIAYSDTWHFVYAMPIVTGDGDFIINESHLS